jgi:hypothetical protein
MSAEAKRSLLGGVVVLALLLAVALGTSVTARTGSTARELDLIASGMVFRTLADGPENPTLDLRAGERLRIVLRNEDTGMRHSLVLPELGLATPEIGPGESAVLEFIASEPGTYVYYCSLHPVTMRGQLVVQPSASSLPHAERAAATTRWAASVSPAAVAMFLPLFFSISRASSTLVPSSRTTSGTLMPTVS